MTLHIKDGGVWREVDAPSTKDGGVWKELDKGFIKNGGVWKQFYESLPPIGSPLEGGYFAGAISHTGDGVPTHLLIVAPKALGEAEDVAWKVVDRSQTLIDPGFLDGAVNTNVLINDSIEHPAALFCANLVIDGYSDWYLPARHELEIAYYNLKPSDFNNNTSSGANLYAVPPRPNNYTLTDPSITEAYIFTEPIEEFSGAYWTSTQIGDRVLYISFFAGQQGSTPFYDATDIIRTRAFRKIALN